MKLRLRALMCASMTVTAIAMIAPAVTAASAPPTPTAPTLSAGPRIMLYGDSLTQGFNADWTWRYRLWESLDAAQAGVDLVGPRNDVVEYTTRQFNSQGYRNPAFDRDHAALAGQRFTAATYGLSEQVRRYRPNVAVGLIGFNDLRLGVSVADLEARWRSEIARSRAAARGLDVVLVQIPHTWLSGADAYDAMLVRLAAELDTPQERVLVTARPPFDVWRDTFDYAHLSSSGERKVAEVVAQSLAQLGIGSGVLADTVDPVDDGEWAPMPSVSVAADSTVAVSWPAVTYASSEHVWVREPSTGAVGVLKYVTGTSASFPAQPGHTYEVWLAPVKGYLPIGTRSAAVTFEVPAA